MARRSHDEIIRDGTWHWRRVYYALGLDIASQRIPPDAQPNQVIFRGVKVTLLPPRTPRTRTRRVWQDATGDDFSGQGQYVDETRNIGTGKTRITVECGCGKVIGYGRMIQHAQACNDARATLDGRARLCECEECVLNDRWMEFEDCPVQQDWVKGRENVRRQQLLERIRHSRQNLQRQYQDGHGIYPSEVAWENERIRYCLAELDKIDGEDGPHRRPGDEPLENPTDAPGARVRVYSITTCDHASCGASGGYGTNDGVHCAYDDTIYETDLSTALAEGERQKDVAKWIIVVENDRYGNPDGRVFMSVRDSEFCEVTENVDEGSSWRACFDMLDDPRKNPDDGDVVDAEWEAYSPPAYEESDVPERYKKIFHKRMREAEASKTESRAATVASVKKALKLPKKNPSPNFEVGDKVQHVKGPKGTVKAKLKNTFGTWDPDRVQVKWDSGEETGCETRNLIKLPKRNPDEDEIDPRYVGWEISDDDERDGEAPRENGKKPYYNQSDYKFYIVNVNTKQILSGWEYAEDARDALNELGGLRIHPFIKVLKQPGRIGLDPDNDRSWEINIPQEVGVRVYNLQQVQAYWGHRTLGALTREHSVLPPSALIEIHRFVDLPTALAEAEKFRDINTIVAIDTEGPAWIVSAGDSEFQRWSELGEGTWYDVIERLLNG